MIKFVLHILDDVLIVSPNAELCSAQLNLFLKLCDFVGVPITHEKTLGPAQVLSFASIELDTIFMEAIYQ